MRFPSLLKIPGHKRFSLNPRYYDPIKEDIENRTVRIKGEMKLRKKMREEGDIEDFESRITGSFSRRAFYKESHTGIRRFSIVIILGLVSAGYLFWGNVALYWLMGLILAIYLFLKFRKN